MRQARILSATNSSIRGEEDAATRRRVPGNIDNERSQQALQTVSTVTKDVWKTELVACQNKV